MSSSSSGDQNGGNLAPRKQSSSRGAPNMKYMHKGVSSLTLLSGGDDPQRNALHELTMISAEARRIPSFYGLMKRNQEDAVELLQTAAKVQQKLDLVSRRSQSAAAQEILSKHSVVLEVLDKLHTIVRDYVGLLQSEVAKSADKPLEKFMASRGRRKAEQFSSALLVEASVLGELSDDLLQHDSDYQLGEGEGEEVVEILDPDGRQMWVDNFGPTAFMVDVVKVVKGLLKYLQRNLSSDERRTLLQVFDPSSTGQISSIRWNEFLKGFGPMKNCLENLHEMLAQPWFHGFLSKSDSTKLLEVEPVGTFMVRFSSTKPGSFSLAHTMQNNIVNHVIIHTRENGFAVREEAREKLFPSVSHLIEAYATLLSHPYSQSFHRQLWWHGDISGDEASELLKDKKPGTFIIRFSSTQRGCFASSFVGKNNVIEKGLIIGSANGYSLSTKHFQSMEELVASLQQWDVFGEPYKNTTNEINDTMRFRIVNEIVQTEQSYVRTLDLIVNLFVREFRANPRIRQEEVNQIFSNVDQLLALHRSFASIIERVIQNWDAENAAIGPHFLQLNPALVPHYSVYVNNYNGAMATLDRLLKKKELKDWVAGVMAKQKSQNMMSGLLIQPVQRIPRYILLLTDLIKHTPGPHSDYDQLGDALEAMKRTADMINESKRLIEDCEAVRQKCIEYLIGVESDQLAVPGRSLIKEGALSPIGAAYNKKDDYYVFVFNDLLLLTKKQGKKFRVKEMLQLDTIQIIPIPETPNTVNQFRICTSQREMTFETDQKTSWVADLKKEFASSKGVK